MSLISSTHLFESLGSHSVDSLSNIWGLLLDVDKHLALIGIKTNIIRCESNVADSVTDNLLVVHLGCGGDLTKHHDHVGLGGSFTCNLGIWIILQAGIENSIGNLIAKLIRMSLVNGLCMRTRRSKTSILIGATCVKLV